MGRRQNRKKTRKEKIKAATLQDYRQIKTKTARECIPEINITPVDYNSMSDIGRAALDNVIALTGRTKEEILLQA